MIGIGDSSALSVGITTAESIAAPFAALSSIELARYTREELQRWQRVIRESGARAD